MGTYVVWEHAFLPDAAGKPVGRNCAIFLSQLIWKCEQHADENGFVEFSFPQCYEQTLLTIREQETIRRILKAAGYIEGTRKGTENGLTKLRVTEKVIRETQNRNYAERRTEEAPREGIYVERVTGTTSNAEPTEPDTPETQNRIYAKRRTLSTKKIEEIPPVTPPTGEITTPKPKAANSFVAPTIEQIAAEVANRRCDWGTQEVHDKAEAIWLYWDERKWIRPKEKAPMGSWVRAVVTWLQNDVRYSTDRGAIARGSPRSPTPGRRDMTMEESANEINERRMARKAARNGAAESGRRLDRPVHGDDTPDGVWIAEFVE